MSTTIKRRNLVTLAAANPTARQLKHVGTMGAPTPD